MTISLKILVISLKKATLFFEMMEMQSKKWKKGK